MEDNNIGDKQQGITETGKEKRQRNLRPQWKPGESGNPQGRPPNELSLTASLRAKLAEVPGQDDGVDNPKGLTWGELFIERLVKRLIDEGEPRLSQQVLDRIDGKVAEKFRVETKVYRTVEE